MAREPRIAGLFALRAISAPLLLLAAAQASAWQCAAARVVRIHDGDTLSVRCGDGAPVKLRLADIDAPELHQADGAAARAALAQAVEGRPLRVESRAVDRYERIVARVDVDGRDLGLALVAEGHAWCGLRPTAACRAALREARQAGRGLWADAQPQAPWQWRREHPRTD